LLAPSGRRIQQKKHKETPLEQTLNRTVLYEKIHSILALMGGKAQHNDLIREIITIALSLSQSEISRSDLRTLHAAFKEMEHAFAFFSPYTEIKKISVFGSARTAPTDPIYPHAADFARQMAQAGFMVITGAGEGIMRAVQGGAGRERSFGMNILLPFEQAANEFIENDSKLITFKYFFTRKLFFVKEADAVVLFPGGFGTHDEGFEVLTLLQTGKSPPIPVVFIDAPGTHHWQEWLSYVRERLLGKGMIAEEDLKLFKITDSVEEAVQEIIHFYRRYHSMQFIDDKVVIRLKQFPTHEQMESLNTLFSDIVVTGRIARTDPLPEEVDEFRELAMPRLLFHFDRKSFGRLREVINTLNDFSTGSEPR
jgi:uncharacterized protein (TIGR00730 family)